MSVHPPTKANINSDVIELSHNSASGNASLVNIGRLIVKLGLSGGDVDDDTGGELDGLRYLEAIFRKLEFLREMSVTSTPAPSPAHESALPTDSTVHDALICRSKPSFWDLSFPRLRPLGSDMLRSVSRYPDGQVGKVVDSLSLQDQDKLFSWAKHASSQLLWIDGCLGTGPSDWTTDLSLEIIGTAAFANSHLATDEMAIVHHFCSETADGRPGQPDVAIQDLIRQLIDSHAHNFTQDACQRCRLNSVRFQEASGCFDGLWDLFTTCVFVSRISTLVVVIDNIDALFAASNRPGDGNAPFRQLVDGLLRLSRTDVVLIKILVTSRMPQASRHFTAAARAPHRHVCLRIPKPPHRKRPPTRSRRKFRALIEALPWNDEERAAGERLDGRVRGTTFTGFEEEYATDVSFPVEDDLYDLDSDHDDDGCLGIERAAGPYRSAASMAGGHLECRIGRGDTTLFVQGDEMDEACSLTYSDLSSMQADTTQARPSTDAQENWDYFAGLLLDSDDEGV
ncbi:hypothetical protein RJ55_04269 [Drechmeria coniospora]|nr:hypothetical protein RJ55_04269 [Drechmeria coniospora]